MALPAKYFILHSGRKLPSVGLGTYQMKGDVLREALDYALFIGYRHIDTALSYGNEKEVGEVIKLRIKDGSIKRDDLFVTTKVPPVYLEHQDCLNSAAESLENLKLKQVDMLLIHNQCANPNVGNGILKPVDENGERLICSVDISNTWLAMEKLVAEGKTRHIGISNFQPSTINKLWSSAKVKPANLQLEAHAYLQQRELGAFCKEKGIIITAYAALGAATRPDQSGNKPVLLEDPTIKRIAEYLGKTPGQVLLNFVLRMNKGVLPKSQTRERIKENIDILDWSLPETDVNKILTLDRNVKYFDFPWMQNHPDFYENEPF